MIRLSARRKPHLWHASSTRVCSRHLARVGREATRRDSLGRAARSRAAGRRNRMRRIWLLLLALALCAALAFFLIEVWQIVEFIYR